MAKNKSTVYLGFDDEEITEKHVSLLSSTLNKIGGTAVSDLYTVRLCMFIALIDFSNMCSLIEIKRIGQMVKLKYQSALSVVQSVPCWYNFTLR